MTEQVKCFFPNLLRIMPCFQHLILVQRIPDTVQFLHKLMCIRSDFLFIIPFRKSSCFEHLEDQDRVMSRQCPAALGNDIRMWDAVFIADIYQCRNGVIHIFLNGIVYTTFTIGRTGSVIINAQSAADVHKLHIESHRVKLHVKLRSFAQSRLNATNLRHLAANMEMNQFQAIFQPLAFHKVKRFEQFAGSQTELAGITTRFFPFSTAGRSQFNTNTDIGLYIQLLRHFGYQFQFIHLLYYEEDTFTHLLGKECQFDITFVFIAVANNQ